MCPGATRHGTVTSDGPQPPGPSEFFIVIRHHTDVMGPHPLKEALGLGQNKRNLFSDFSFSDFFGRGLGLRVYGLWCFKFRFKVYGLGLRV